MCKDGNVMYAMAREIGEPGSGRPREQIKGIHDLLETHVHLYDECRHNLKGDDTLMRLKATYDGWRPID